MSDNDLLAQLLAETGSELGPAPDGRSVQDSADLRRILALPRRQWENDIERLVEPMSRYLRAPGGTQTLRPGQVAFLRDVHDQRGAFGPLRTGLGKTVLSLLTFTVLSAKRPMLIVPAALRDKTFREMHNHRKHWLVPVYVRIVSYELLGREQSANLLEEWNPDVLVMDECHRAKNRSASGVRRIGRYIAAHPETRVAAMSGSVMKRSVKNFAHIIDWCLRERSPAPRDFKAVLEWGMALDELHAEEQTLEPGALFALCGPEEAGLEPLKAIRRGFRRRLTDTPGVVATQEGALGVSLRVAPWPIHVPEILPAATSLRTSWLRPDGVDCMDGIEVWRHLHELACGFFYRWSPAPPREWLDARGAWTRFVRHVLKHNQRHIDSEGAVATAVDEGLYPNEVLIAWRAIKDVYDPEKNKEAVWLSTRVLDACIAWAQEKKGIIWVAHTAFGEALAARSGLDFYWRQGRNARGQPIEDHPADRPLIASIAANSTGRNLQKWSTNLIVSHPTGGDNTEQLYSRTHRDGQEAEEVEIDVCAAIPEQLIAFDKACADARAITDMIGQEQRLCYADIVIPPDGPERAALFAPPRAAKIR